MKFLLTSLLMCLTIYNSKAQLNVDLVGQLEYGETLSDLWGYVGTDGTEYALVGTQNGFSIVSLADHANPVELFYYPGGDTPWRDVKVWGNTAYVVCDVCTNGLLVVDLSDLPNSAPHYFLNNIPGAGVITGCHNVYIDENGYLYIAGCNINEGGVIIMDVFTTPGTPIYVSNAPAVYSHDIFVRDNIMYSSGFESGELIIYDVTDKENITTINSFETPFSQTHNAWLSDDSQTLFVSEETGNAAILSYDVSDLSNINDPLYQFRPGATLGEGVIPHNVHVIGDHLVISYYIDGCVIVDASDPTNLVEVGNYDTSVGDLTGFNGAWGVYPDLPSGYILIADVNTGLFVVDPNYVYASYLQGNITDSSNGQPISNATVTIQAPNFLGVTDFIGDYKTGIPTPGTFSVTVENFAHAPFSAEVELSTGNITILDAELDPLPPFTGTGTVVDESGIPIADAVVELRAGSNIYEATTNESGNFSLENIVGANYEIVAGKWGYESKLTNEILDSNSPSITIALEEGYKDNFLIDLGWDISGFGTPELDIYEPVGVWVDQFGYTFWVAPPMDSDDDIGNSCYVTGNGTDIIGDAFTGTNALTSPTIDMSDWEEPIIEFNYWFVTAKILAGQPVIGTAQVIIFITNGSGIETIGAIDMVDSIHAPAWTNYVINLNDFTDDITETMSIQFKLDSPPLEVTECAFDNFKAYDGMEIAVGEVDENIGISVYPNPSENQFYLNYNIDQIENSSMVVYNILGQQIDQQSLLQKEGVLGFGKTLEPGIYFVRIETNGLPSKSIKVVKQ